MERGSRCREKGEQESSTSHPAAPPILDLQQHSFTNPLAPPSPSPPSPSQLPSPPPPPSHSPTLPSPPHPALAPSISPSTSPAAPTTSACRDSLLPLPPSLCPPPPHQASLQPLQETSLRPQRQSIPTPLAAQGLVRLLAGPQQRRGDGERVVVRTRRFPSRT